MSARLFSLLLLLALLPGCAAAPPAAPAPAVQVVLEQGQGFDAAAPVATTAPGGTVRFALRMQDGYTPTGADYPGAVLDGTGSDWTLTVPQVRYPTVVSVTVQQSAVTLLYHANGGLRLDGGAAAQAVGVPVTPTHLRLNTATGQGLFARAGYLLTGWNTAPDGSGTAVGLGSRVAWQDGLVLYAQWAQCAAESDFTYTPSGDGVAITGYSGSAQTLAIPPTLGGAPVYAIATGALAGSACQTVIVPPGVRSIQANAFENAALQTLVLFDDLHTVSAHAFAGCAALQTLRLNAAAAPVYSGSYYATFADKYDRLCALRSRKKLVLFSGSSTRFGYDSAALDAALPGYEVVNMGVFAYSNATPQLLLILQQLQRGDVLLHAPEFDAAQRQFCTTNTLDAAFFNMMEANYDVAAALDMRALDGVFAALGEYLSVKATLPARSYAETAADYDEDGNPVSTPSYNAYGDYILYRPNAADDAPVYGLPVDYTTAAYPAQQFLQPLNAMYRRFLQKGVAVYFTYAPRNSAAISQSSTPAARAALHDYLRGGLVAPVISDIEQSLYPGRYLFGTDNHLSTEGVRLRTARILADLTAAMAGEGSA